ncbi:MAG: hypothetical protein AAGA58_01045 [Verrucomicrobiota bacterium]
MTELTDEQKAKIVEWVGDGADLNAIQDRLRDEFEMRLSFMDTRFLISDLNLEIHETEEEQPAEESETAGESATSEEPAPGPEDDLLGDSGTVSVTMDSVGRPGMIASGQVTFSDGKKATWYFDQMGRLGLDPDEADYRPSEEDLIAFQDELQRVAGEAGL